MANIEINNFLLTTEKGRTRTWKLHRVIHGRLITILTVSFIKLEGVHNIIDPAFLSERLVATRTLILLIIHI